MKFYRFSVILQIMQPQIQLVMQKLKLVLLSSIGDFLVKFIIFCETQDRLLQITKRHLTFYAV